MVSPAFTGRSSLKVILVFSVLHFDARFHLLSRAGLHLEEGEYK